MWTWKNIYLGNFINYWMYISRFYIKMVDKNSVFVLTVGNNMEAIPWLPNESILKHYHWCLISEQHEACCCYNISRCWRASWTVTLIWLSPWIPTWLCPSIISLSLQWTCHCPFPFGLASSSSMGIWVSVREELLINVKQPCCILWLAYQSQSLSSVTVHFTPAGCSWQLTVGRFDSKQNKLMSVAVSAAETLACFDENPNELLQEG